MNLKRFFALMLALTLSLTMLQGVAFGATTLEVNGINYEVVTSPAGANNGTVKVIDLSSGKYTGEITIPATVTSSGNTYTVTSIGDWAFYSSDITSVAFAADSQLKEIGFSAFLQCSSLTSVTLPTTLLSIGKEAFSGCIGLTSINIPASVATIEEAAFRGCEKLKTVTFAAGSQLTEIGNKVFEGCSSLTSITIPSGVTSIGRYAFAFSDLTSITFEGTPSIGYGVFGLLSNVDVPPVDTITFAGAYNEGMVDDVIAALVASGRIGSDTPKNITGTGLGWTQDKIDTMIATLQNGGTPPTPPPTPNPTPTGGSGSAGSGSAGAGAWYIGTLTPGGSGGAGGSTFVPTYTQISDEQSTTQMLQAGNTITVTGQSPTGIIVKLNPTALSGKQSLSINSSIADMQLTAEQIASLIQQAGGNTIHITIKQTADSSTISILAGGRTITL